MFIVYKNINELFYSFQQEKHLNRSNDLTALESQLDMDLIVASNIISFKMNKMRDISFLKQNPIQLAFKHVFPSQYEFEELENSGMRPICAFWNYSKT